MAKEWREGELGGISLLAGGFVLVAMSWGGYLLGSWVDRALHDTSPKAAIIGLILGTLGGFWDLYRIVSRVMLSQPLPSAAARKAAKENWKKTEEAAQDEGERDTDRE